MLSGVSIICFVGSYLVALVLEVTRLWFRSAIRGALMLAFIGAGLLAQSAFLYYQAKETPGLPLSSPRDWCLLASWALAVLYLYLTYHYPKAHFGLFLLPLILLLIAFGAWLADPNPFPRGPASQVWGIIHGVSILAASVSVIFGFVSGLMYLMQSRRLKQKKMPRQGLLLPSLEWLQKINSRTIVISTVLLGIGVLSGGILIRLSGKPTIPWSDPVIVTTIALFLWLLGSSIVATFYHPAREGRKVAYLTVVNFVFLAVGLTLVFLVDTEHGGRRAEGPEIEASLQFRLDEGRRQVYSGEKNFIMRNYSNGA
ncbi:MAG: cytochrome c biogenesis protein CcsA [Planctomycetia bacterium]|jgi:ABC-type uncharacterized transport system permease subunit